MRAIAILAVSVAASLAAGAAHAIDVHQSVTVAKPAAELWDEIGAFCAIGDWHPAVAECVESEADGQTRRTLTLADGGSIVERLIERTDTGYTYEILESPLPVANYRSTFSVKAEGDGSVVDWTGTFDAKDASDADAQGVITGIYAAGLEQIRGTAGN